MLSSAPIISVVYIIIFYHLNKLYISQYLRMTNYKNKLQLCVMLEVFIAVNISETARQGFDTV